MKFSITFMLLFTTFIKSSYGLIHKNRAILRNSNLRLYSEVTDLSGSSTIPLCVNCKHFIKDATNYPYDNPPNDSFYGKCSKFGEMDLVTGQQKYTPARLCRDYDRLCGKKGKYFSKKPTPGNHTVPPDAPLP